MTTVRGLVPTPNGGKYVRQLCKHWSHKLDTSLDGETGTIRFPAAVVTFDAREDVIALDITGDDPAEIERLRGVVERHLDRFAFREAPLQYDWLEAA
ncbi:MAG: DUF2218 domain-containing protein [Novosphingobium sp.]|nr:DUF2218 domain-containing protein [Novosphingobium sp.]